MDKTGVKRLPFLQLNKLCTVNHNKRENPQGTNQRLPFAVNVAINFSINLTPDYKPLCYA